MNKIFLASILAVAGLTANAQNAYDAANFTQTDLNGSARYVGMGGALNALGGDISVMSSNPAATGLYRRSDIGLSLGGQITGQDAQLSGDRSKFSFDQAGAVFAFQVDNSGNGLQYVNIGVNYRKNRNYLGNIFTNVNHLNNTYSQTYQIADLANDNDYYQPDNWGLLADMGAPFYEYNEAKDEWEMKHDGVIGEDEEGYFGLPAQDANYRRHTYGSNNEYDVNLSFNVSDKFYFGATLGIYDLDFSRESFYEELGVDGVYYDFTNWYRTLGTGFDLKLGFICRPIEESPFRFGIAINTPTWYRMTDANGSELYMNDQYICDRSSDTYDYRLRTPWRFNLSLGHTFGKKVAVGAEYELTDFGSARYNSVDWQDRQYMKDKNTMSIKPSLKAQHTLKLGVEYKPVSNFALRAGYNYLSSPYKNDAYKTILYFEPSTETDFTNWKGMNRVTCGMGYSWKGGYVDLAYQYQCQKGDFYAFDDIDLKATTIKDSRSQIVATLGFRF